MSEINRIINQEPEEPIFIIEKDYDEVRPTANPPKQPMKRWLVRLLKAAAIFVCFLLALYAYRQWDYYYNIGRVSVSPKENIEKLQQPVKAEKPQVVMTSDSLLGVALDLYAIHGLHATLTFEEPDTADTSVYLYCRSCDHRPDKSYHGTLVVDGKEYQRDQARLGYMAMADGKQVIGVSRSDKVKDYVMERGGSYFRQFMLVSDGDIAHHYYLHGKVERRAIGRIGDQLYYIATRNAETLWGFADALREYGFIDVIYITGGKDYSYYRSADGQRHDIGDATEYPNEKWKGIIPWLVFKK